MLNGPQSVNTTEIVFSSHLICHVYSTFELVLKSAILVNVLYALVLHLWIHNYNEMFSVLHLIYGKIKEHFFKSDLLVLTNLFELCELQYVVIFLNCLISCTVM